MGITVEILFLAPVPFPLEAAVASIGDKETVRDALSVWDI